MSILELPRLRSARQRNTVLAGIFCITVVIHAAWSWVPSFWFDEAATLRLARLPWDRFLQFIGERDAVHASYAALMHVWIPVFGESELSVRLPSILATGLAAVGVFLITEKVGGTSRGALAAAVVFAFLPRVLIQTVEARSYMISTALLVGGALLVLTAKTAGKAFVWCLYVATTTLAIWFFAYAALVLPALVLLGDDPSKPVPARLRRLILTGGLPAALSLPLAFVMLRQQGQVSWLDTQTLNLYTVLSEPFFNWAVWLAVAFAVVVIVSVTRKTFPPMRAVLPFWTWLALPAIVLLLITVLYQPIFTPRYITVSSPAVAIILGLAIGRWSRKLVFAIGAGWALLAVPSWVASRLPESKPGGVNLRAVAEFIEHHAEDGDAFILGNTGPGPLRPRAAIAAYPSAFMNLQDVALERSYADTGTFWDDVRVPTSTELRDLQRIWTVSRVDDKDLRAALDVAGFEETEDSTIAGMQITAWERP